MFQPCIPIVLPVSGQLGEYELRPIDHATLHRFQNRTIETFGHPSVRSWYGQAVLKLGALVRLVKRQFTSDLYPGLITPSSCSIPSSSTYS